MVIFDSLDRLAQARAGDVILRAGRVLCLLVCLAAVYGVVVSIPRREYLDVFLTNPLAFLISLVLMVAFSRIRRPHGSA
jgi:hypothetical protein